MTEASTPTLLTEHEVRRLAVADQTSLAAVRDAIAAEARGDVAQPAPFHLDIATHNGELHVKGAYISHSPYFVVKMATGYFDNPSQGLPSSGGMFVVFDATTGRPALLIADNGYLTDLRTGLAGAVSIDALARPQVDTVAVLGTGIQARQQMRSLLLVRRPHAVHIWGRDAERSQLLRRDLSEMADWEVTVCSSVEAATSGADVVVTTTPATSPLLYGHHLRDGMHVTAVGSDSPGKSELDVSVLNRASLIAVDDASQSPVRGELQTKPDAGVPVVKLGDILNRPSDGRRRNEDITVCDLIGIGAEDAAIGSLVAQLVLGK